MSELKPCPFCGHEASYSLDPHYDDKHVIACDYCGCERRYEYSVDGVIEEWNTRHITAADVPEAVRREIQAEALERFAREWLEGLGHLDQPTASDVICDVFKAANDLRVEP